MECIGTIEVNYPYDFSNLISIKFLILGHHLIFIISSMTLSFHLTIFEQCKHMLGESYFIGGNNYDSTGTYIDTLLSSIGCDSIVTTT